jgi:hypothetical protein
LAGQWFSPVSSTNKTDRHDITEKLLKWRYTITLTITPFSVDLWCIMAMIVTDCIGSYKSNYHMIMTTTIPYTEKEKILKQK